MHPVILLLLSSITTDWVWLLIFTRFLDHTQQRTTVRRTPLNEWSVRRTDLYPTTQQPQQTNIHAHRRAEDFYLPLKIRRLRPGLNPRTWVPKASTLPLDHRRYRRWWDEFHKLRNKQKETNQPHLADILGTCSFFFFLVKRFFSYSAQEECF